MVFNVSGTVLSVILPGLAIVQPKVGAGAAARRKGGGGAGFFNGISKGGFKLEVIGMFTLERRKSKSRV